jgi:hypothetical protein
VSFGTSWEEGGIIASIDHPSAAAGTIGPMNAHTAMALGIMLCRMARSHDEPWPTASWSMSEDPWEKATLKALQHMVDGRDFSAETSERSSISEVEAADVFQALDDVTELLRRAGNRIEELESRLGEA